MTEATHGKILPAIADAMSEVTKVGKDDRNNHDGYNFASIDNFLALVNPICAKHGLVILSDETQREEFEKQGKYGVTSWMRVTFSFTIYHKSGESLPTMHRTAEVIRNGAQAYGSAQSYCLKQFLRGLFLIPTGDKDDPDNNATDPGQVVRRDAPTPQPDLTPEQKRDKVLASIAKAADAEALTALWTNKRMAAGVSSLPEPMQLELQKAYADRQADLHKPVEGELADDEIPY